MVHNPSARSEDDISELAGRQQLDDPLLHVSQLDIVSGRDGASLVDAAIELDDDLAIAMVVDFFEFANVSVSC